MAATIAAAQAVLKISANDAKPDHTLDTSRGLLLGHLTKGWSGSDWVGDAFSCKGTVPVSGSVPDLTRLDVGFVQIARATVWQGFYAGRMASEGSIALDYFVPPALTSKVLLDATKTARDPWYRNPIPESQAGPRTAEFGDHPGMVMRLSLENRRRSNVRNFLFHAIMEREFFTILTGLETGGTPTYIAHFTWRLRYEFKLNWRGGQPNVRNNASTFAILKTQIAGRPKDADLQSLLDNPRGERANSIGTRVEATTLTGNPPNRTDNRDRFLTVPPDFWT